MLEDDQIKYMWVKQDGCSILFSKKVKEIKAYYT